MIGAGSTYTPELVSGLMRERERIDVRELVLHDIDPDRQEVVGGLVEGWRGRLTSGSPRRLQSAATATARAWP